MDFYVASYGNDSNTGTLSSPFLTCQKALDTTLNYSDTVFNIYVIDKVNATINSSIGILSFDYNHARKTYNLIGVKSNISKINVIPTNSTGNNCIIDGDISSSSYYKQTQLNVYNLIIYNENSFKGDIIVSRGTPADYAIYMNFYNCVIDLDYTPYSNANAFRVGIGTSGDYGYKYEFYNCTINVPKWGTDKSPHLTKFYNCATTLNNFDLAPSSYLTKENCVTNVEYDKYYRLLQDNKIYGVYSGEHYWNTGKKFIKYRNNLYTLNQIS